MKKLMRIYFAIVFQVANSQSLSIERVNKIKASTVRVMVNNGESIGTGFFINKEGDVATCWHVINGVQNPGTQRVYIEFNDGDTASMLPKYSPSDSDTNFDFFIITPAKKITNKFEFYKLGNFSNLKEGEGVYTCGYTLGYKNQFITNGIVSTKIIDPKYPSAALLQLPTNRGNSGGQIIKIGKSLAEDEIVGIATFILSPMAPAIKSIDSMVDKTGSTQALTNVHFDASGKMTSGNDLNKITHVFAETFSYMSIGITGSYSIDYLSAFLRAKMKDGQNIH